MHVPRLRFAQPLTLTLTLTAISLAITVLLAGCPTGAGVNAPSQPRQRSRTCKVAGINGDDPFEPKTYFIELDCVGWNMFSAPASLNPSLKRTQAGHRVKVTYQDGEQRFLKVLAFRNLSL